MASIKCANCKGTHGSVQDVKDCFDGKKVAVLPEQGITPGQLKFLAVLRTERHLVTDGIGGLTRQQASDEIAKHLSPEGKQARRVVAADAERRAENAVADGQGGWVASDSHGPARPKLPDIPEGHYAVPSANGKNDLDFWWVQRPVVGPYKGRTFVKKVVGGRPDMRVYGIVLRKAMTSIANVGPEAAALKYSQEMDSCAACNRHLTDDASRALGFGPDCAELRGLGVRWRELDRYFRNSRKVAK
jgi:hypothetical protein